MGQHQSDWHWRTTRTTQPSHLVARRLRKWTTLIWEVRYNRRVGRRKIRIEKAATVYQMRRRKMVEASAKVQVFWVMVMLVLHYGAETWLVTQQDIRILKTFQMRCLWDIVGVTLWDMQRNVDILDETGELPIKEQQIEETPVVRTAVEDARPLTTEATAAVQTEEKRGSQKGLACGG